MNNYIKMFMVDNNLKEGESFKIKYFDNEFWFDSYGYLNFKIKDDYDDYTNLTCMLLNGDVQVEKLSPIPTERFIPKEKEKYWFVTCFNEVVSNNFIGVIGEKYLFEHTLVFKTKEQAEDYKWFLDKVDEYKKPLKPKECNYYLFYDHDDKKVYRTCDTSCQGQGNVYFGDKENIEKFLEEVGKERIKKYMFDIWK